MKLGVHFLFLVALSFSATTVFSSTSSFAGTCFSCMSAESERDYYLKQPLAEVKKQAEAGNSWAQVEYARRLGFGFDDLTVDLDRAIQLLDLVIKNNPKYYYGTYGWIYPEVSVEAAKIRAVFMASRIINGGHNEQLSDEGEGN